MRVNYLQNKLKSCKCFEKKALAFFNMKKVIFLIEFLKDENFISL